MVAMHFSDPEAKSFLEESKRILDQQWLLGQLGDATYLRSLMIAGYSDRDAHTELNLLKLAKKDRWRV